MTNPKAPKLTVPLCQEAHANAQKFAAQQATPQKGKQVYLNTLAVYAVHSYLKWLQIETNFLISDSWHPGKRVVFDVADLALPSIGNLECRPVLPGETAVDLPPEVTENRIGYIGVQFSERLDEVQLLGFIPAVDPALLLEQIQIADFQPLDTLMEHLHQLREVRSAEQPNEQVQTLSVETISTRLSQRINLSQWLQRTFETGWQTVDALLGTEKAKLALSFRSAYPFNETQPNHLQTGVRRAKLIDLGLRLAGHPVALVVALTPSAEEDVDILLQLHPLTDAMYLPPQLQMVVLDEAGTTVLEAQARSADNYIQLQFSGEPGETFSVKVVLSDVSITESFLI